MFARPIPSSSKLPALVPRGRPTTAAPSCSSSLHPSRRRPFSSTPSARMPPKMDRTLRGDRQGSSDEPIQVPSHVVSLDGNWERATVSPIDHALRTLPTVVNRPGKQYATEFPPAVEPDRAMLYNRAMDRARPKLSKTARVGKLGIFVFAGWVMYYMCLVQDWGPDNEDIFAKWRRDRLKRKSLYEPLTPQELAILARPEPKSWQFPNPLDLIRAIPSQHARRTEMRFERRERYLARMRAENGGDDPEELVRIDWRKWARVLDEAPVEWRFGQVAMPEKIDWARITAA